MMMTTTSDYQSAGDELGVFGLVWIGFGLVCVYVVFRLFSSAGVCVFIQAIVYASSMCVYTKRCPPMCVHECMLICECLCEPTGTKNGDGDDVKSSIPVSWFA